MSAQRRSRRSVPWWLISLVLLLLLVIVIVLLWERIPGAAPTQQGGPSPVPSPVAGGPNGPVEVYFTTPVYPDRPATRHGGIDEKFVAFVDAATKTLDIAAYEFDLENVAQAIRRARQRGVAVRMVTDSDTVNDVRDPVTQNALKIVRDAGVTIVPDERTAIMHDKFAVRDGQEIWTGSWNLTVGDTYRLNNNAIRMVSPELARIYTQEFEFMFVQRKFGAARPRNTAHPPVQVGGMQVQVLFAPEDGVAQRIADRINQTGQSIQFLAFSFTHDAIGQAVKTRAKAGVSVAGVFEKTGSETRFSEYGAMKQAGLEVYQDSNPYVMHHKVFVLDGRTTLMGSFNFSDSADRDNDENLLIVDDPGFARLYAQEFERMLTLARTPSGARATPEKERPR